MLKQKFQDIKVGGVNYRLTKMDARTGSYLALKLVTLMKPGSGAEAQGQISEAFNSLSRKDFDELQNLILSRVQKLTDGMPEPIIKANGDFVDPELAYDVSTVINLTMQCLVFNIGGFFGEAGLNLPA